MAVLDDPTVRDILGEGRQLHVAVATQHGPHVTPELYALAGGRLWFLTAFATPSTWPPSPPTSAPASSASSSLPAG